MTTTLTWLGHSAWQIDTAGKRVLIDPFFTGNPAAAVKADDVTCDFILVSHGHGDHVGDTAEIAKRTGALVIANAEIADWLDIATGTVYNVRQRYLCEGLPGALYEKPRPGQGPLGVIGGHPEALAFRACQRAGLVQNGRGYPVQADVVDQARPPQVPHLAGGQT